MITPNLNFMHLSQCKSRLSFYLIPVKLGKLGKIREKSVSLSAKFGRIDSQPAIAFVAFSVEQSKDWQQSIAQQ
jgi:uncharacterized membrane protein